LAVLAVKAVLERPHPMPLYAMGFNAQRCPRPFYRSLGYARFISQLHSFGRRHTNAPGQYIHEEIGCFIHLVHIFKRFFRFEVQNVVGSNIALANPLKTVPLVEPE
jgi:hypothetical protein